MGLFDYFVSRHKCPVCKAVLKDWQTKDLHNCMDRYEVGGVIDSVKLLDPEVLARGSFYVHSMCDKCRCWMEAEVKFNKRTGLVEGHCVRHEDADCLVSK